MNDDQAGADAGNRVAADSAHDVGVVAIGRNEGERLRHCLTSAATATQRIVYVDSGSNDDSVMLARELGAEVVQLDLAIPFTAARARNAGFQRMREVWPGTRFVQFVDGDCEFASGWITTAHAFLESNPRYAAVHGRRRERYPDATIYNRLCDLEWERPTGDTSAFGGDVLLRCDAMDNVGGYREDFIAGEEPELSVRLRSQGWVFRCIAEEMTIHDADMRHFRQWWRRSERCGYAYALGAATHGSRPERHKVRETSRTLLWSLGPTSCAAVLAAMIGSEGLLVLLVYPFQVLRLYAQAPGTRQIRLAWALSQTLGKFAELQGQLTWLRDEVTGRRRTLIEYK